jgi:hypothetical protein
VPDTTRQIDYLALDDSALLAQCEVHTYRASGPGGQHRNKTYSAVRLLHKPTGISAQGEDSRSQHENKHAAVQRLRMNLALQLRRPLDRASPLPELIASYVHSRGTPGARLNIGRKDANFWAVSRFVLDVLAAYEARVAEAAAHLGITTSNLIAHVRKDRHLFGVVQEMRKQFGHVALK